MNIADRLIFQSRSKHLNDLERSIVEGVCEGKKYKDIAEQKMPPCTEAHVSEVAANLWKAISEALGEEVKKSNFKSTIERHQGEYALSNEFVQIGHLNLCSGITINNQPKDRNYYANSNSLTVSPQYLKNIPDS